MAVINDLNKIEDAVIENYRKLPVWTHIRTMDKAELSKLLLRNYSYSAHFAGILERAYQHARHKDSQAALHHIIDEENSPQEHNVLHRKMLKACGLKGPFSSNLEKHSAADRLVNASRRYSHASDDESELGMLCYFRIGAEILPGELYGVLREIVPPRFEVRESDIEFITLHAEHDCKTTDLGIDPDIDKQDRRGRSPHADHFNEAITRLVRHIGPESLAPAKAAYEDAFILRKDFLEYLATGRIDAAY